MADIKELGDNKYKIQNKEIVMSFKFNDGKITLLDKTGEPKGFHFVDSDLERFWLVADTFKKIVAYCHKLEPREEILIGDHKYVLAEGEDG